MPEQNIMPRVTLPYIPETQTPAEIRTRSVAHSGAERAGMIEMSLKENPLDGIPTQTALRVESGEPAHARDATLPLAVEALEDRLAALERVCAGLVMRITILEKDTEMPPHEPRAEQPSE